MKIDRLYIFIKWPKLLSIVTQGQKVANHNTTQEHKCIYGMEVTIHSIILQFGIGMKLRTKNLENNTSKRLIV